MYDPLVAHQLSACHAYPSSYWAAITPQRIQFPKLQADMDTPVAIIGGGFTGLSAALTLLKYNQPFVLLEANDIGWGASGRNAGFVLPSSGRLDFSQLVSRYGKGVADGVIAEYYQALDTLDAYLEELNIQADQVQGGYLKIAHNRKLADKIRRGWQAMPRQFQQQYVWLEASQIAAEYLPDYPGFGGLWREQGQGLNPLKLAIGMATRLQQADCGLYTHSPIDRWTVDNQTHVLHCGVHQIRAQQVLLCSNAYTPRSISHLANRQFPVLSSILVTEPLPDQLAQGWRAGLMGMDTRPLKYYYRLLPDKRLLFGGRGAVTGQHANSQRSQRRLIQALHEYFPSLSSLKIDYFWSGWVGVAADDIPHITIDATHQGVYYAAGFCGSGLAFSAHAGRRLAERVVGERLPLATELIYHQPLPAFPMPSFRRIGLRLMYAWQRMLI